MQREEIDRCWPLVVQHSERVLSVSAAIASKYRCVLRIDRQALLGMYTAGADFSELARHFRVSAGSINSALSRLVTIARNLDRFDILRRAANGQRLVVIVPVSDLASAEYVRHVLASHEFSGVVERVEESDSWRLDVPEHGTP
jgi:hypothetical protein